MSTTEQTWGQFRGQNKYFYQLKWQFWQVYLTQILQAYILKLKVSRQKTNFSIDILRDSIRNRAKQLVAWILESGNDLKLGITKMDILNGQIVKKRSQSATSRADLWAQRYYSQNFAVWNSPAGKV